MQKYLVRHNRHIGSGSTTANKLPLVQLEIVRGAARHRTRPIAVPTFLVGTAEDCDMVLGDPQFGEVHFYILRNERAVTIRHLGSFPELTINSQPVHTATLKNNDRIRSGSYEFRIRIRWPERDDSSNSTAPHSDSQSQPPGQSALQLAEHLLNDIRNEIIGKNSNLRIYKESQNPATPKPSRFAS